jgi:RNA polymerase sigma-70 factor, ECF subfamily
MSASLPVAADLDDAALVLRARRGDTAAFDVLVRRFLRPAVALAFRILGQREDAEDIVQESFIAALDALDGFDLRRPFTPWFLRIVLNRALNARRSRDRHPTESLGMEVRADIAPPSAAVEEREAREWVRGALERLPERQRTIMQLSGFDGLSSAEVGELLSIAPGTVRWELHQARATLRNELATWSGGGS